MSNGIDRPELKIGSKNDIVFDNEIGKQLLTCVVYDYDGNDIIISQTSTRLNHRFLNRRVLVTFLANSEKRILRFGFAN
jgi:hypothetical protein